MTADRCPDCSGPIKLTRGQKDRGRITKKARICITHRRSCPQWLQRARAHGAHPDITVLIHGDAQVTITEGAAA